MADFSYLLWDQLWRTKKAASSLVYWNDFCTRANKLKTSKKVKSATYSGVQSSGVAGVVVTLALWIRATVDSNAGARGELVAGGAQRRVWRRRPRIQTTGQRAGCHQKLWHKAKQKWKFQSLLFLSLCARKQKRFLFLLFLKREKLQMHEEEIRSCNSRTLPIW